MKKLLAAALFGLSAPAAKRLAGTVDPWLLAGLLYLGSGIGLGLYRLAQRLIGHVGSDAPLRRQDLPWLSGAIAAGGIIGPVLLMYGLAAGTAEGVQGVIPTVTYPSHTTLITGVWPAKHGIFGNTTFDPLRENPRFQKLVAPT